MPSKRPHRVAVIGAGISGVVTAAHLRREGLDVTVFERSSAAGGIWLFDERKPLEPRYPSLTASTAEEAFHESLANAVPDQKLLQHAPPGPCYIGLKNNVGTRLLRTSLNPFPPDTPDFVSHTVLQDYIQDTSRKTGVDALTSYNTEVRRLYKTGSRWTLSAANSGDENQIWTEEYDAVVVASGHYHAPRIPDIPGLTKWKSQWPDRVQHSKRYRDPADFKGKNFLLIGGSVSATDIARELGPQADNIYQSHRNGAFDLPASLLPENGIRVDEVVSFDDPKEDGSTEKGLKEDEAPIPATVTLKNGHKLCDIHHVILCTGYHITLPYLGHLHADNVLPEQADDRVLVTDGMQYHNLHKDIFYIPDPTLAFVGVPYFTATFTLFEFQAMVLAKVFSGQAHLPSEGDMREEYDRRVREKGYGKAFHSLRDKEVEYVNELLGWVNQDLRTAGLAELDGHTSEWHAAREEQVQRIKALLAGEAGAEKTIGVVCY